MISARETMIAGVLAQGLVGDRAFAAERAVKAIVAKAIPSPKIEVEPQFIFDLICGVFKGGMCPCLFWIGCGNLSDPRIRFSRSTPKLSCAKGLDQFPKAPSTNSISMSATRAAALSMSTKSVRYDGSVSTVRPSSGV